MKINVKKIFGIGIGVLGAAASILAIFGGRDSFSDFLKNASDEELAAEREKIRLDYCNPDLDNGYRVHCQSVLRAFDKEMSKRAWGDEEPRTSVYRREHGWYLPNDD